MTNTRSHTASLLLLLHSALQGAKQRQSFPLRLLVLPLRIGVRHNAGSRLDVGRSALDDEGANEETGIQPPRKIQIADHSRVRAPAAGLQLVYDLHSPYLGRPGNCAGRKCGSQDVGGPVFIPDLTGDAGNHMHDAVSYTHLRAHETVLDLVCRLLLEKK